ncbi:MAG TPA: histidine kinase [Longimicrobium sp.]|nr:histidine kinase [Longimicrobium sp.]
MAALAGTRELLGVALAVSAFCAAAWIGGYYLLLRQQLSLGDVLVVSAFDAGSTAAAFAGGLVVGWMLPAGRAPTRRNAAVVAAFALALSLVRVVADYLVEEAVEGLTWVPFDRVLAETLPGNLLATTTFVGLGVGLRAVVEQRHRAAAAAWMQAELARARRRVLHSRLQPEFLLASFDAISRRIPRDAGAADRLLLRVSELLRLSLERARADQVTLAAELEYVAAFLDVHAGRGGQAADLRERVPGELLAARVPAGSVSAFVEAALGAAAAGVPPVLAVEARAEGARLRLRVSDGVRVPAAARDQEGVRALARSLEELYGDDQRFGYTDVPGGGAEGVLELPLRPGNAVRRERR